MLRTGCVGRPVFGLWDLSGMGVCLAALESPPTSYLRELAAFTSPTPAGWGPAQPVKAGLYFSKFCIPYKELASVARFFSNPLNFKNRH